MALPYTIANGQLPDATKVQANFDYLFSSLATAGITSATFASLRVTAAAAPTTPFMCIATDDKLFMLYCGDATQGDGGFITILGFGGIS